MKKKTIENSTLYSNLSKTWIKHPRTYLNKGVSQSSNTQNIVCFEVVELDCQSWKQTMPDIFIVLHDLSLLACLWTLEF
jgi:hypothetical protein